MHLAHWADALDVPCSQAFQPGAFPPAFTMRDLLPPTLTRLSFRVRTAHYLDEVLEGCTFYFCMSIFTPNMSSHSTLARWLSWLEHLPVPKKVAGSIPGGGSYGGT